MTRAALLVAYAVTLAAAVPRGARAELSLVNVSAAFPPGPYTALHVDASRPERLAVGTLGGQVAWSDDGGRSTHEAQVLSKRRYDVLAIRGSGARAQLARPTYTQRAIRLFIQAMREGAGVARWAYWMAMAEPYTDVTAIAMPAGEGRMAVAHATGISVSDRGGGAWTKTFGGASPMPREDAPAAFAVTIDPSDPNRMLAGTSHGVMVSENGGLTFAPHPDPRLRDEYIVGFRWDTRQPRLLLALTGYAVLQSSDAGASFEVAFSSQNEVLDVAVTDSGGYVATSDGLVVIGGGAEPETVLRGQRVVGVAVVDEGLLVCTSTELLLWSPGAGRLPLAHTTEEDPFLALRGGPELAFALTSRAVLRIGPPTPRGARDRDVPRMRLSLAATEAAVDANLGYGGPDDTRLHDRWYAKLLPRLMVDVVQDLDTQGGVLWDGTFPVRFREADGTSRGGSELAVFAWWDLEDIVFGDHNVSNPNLLLESGLRESRVAIRREVRTRYREAASLARTLERPPTDPVQTTLLRLRLAEHAAYLEALAGREVVEGDEP